MTARASAGAATALHLVLPERLLIAPRYVLPGLEPVLLLPLIAVDPKRPTRQARTSRALSLRTVA